MTAEAVHIPGQVDFPIGCGRQTVLLPSAPVGGSGPPLSIKVPPGPASAPAPNSADSRAPASSSSSRKGSACGSQQLPVQASDGRGGRQDKQQRRLALQKISSRIKQAAEDPALPLQPPPRPPPAVSAAARSPLPSPSPAPAADTDADADCRQVRHVRHPPLI